MPNSVTEGKYILLYAVNIKIWLKIWNEFLFEKWDNPFKLLADIIVQCCYCVTVFVLSIIVGIQFIFIFAVLAFLESLKFSVKLIRYNQINDDEEAKAKRRESQHRATMFQLLLQTLPMLLIVIINTSDLQIWTDSATASVLCSSIFLFQKVWFYAYFLLHLCG